MARTLFSRLSALGNLRENKVLANKTCFTVCEKLFKNDKQGVKWIGCSKEGCTFWAHYKCVGIFPISRHIDDSTFDFYCEIHRNKIIT